MSPRILLIVGCLILLSGVYAAEHSAHPPVDTAVEEHPPQADDGAVLISIKQFKYLPAQVKVKKDAKVRWTNEEKRQYHNVWFQSLGEAEPPYLFPGDVYERVFATPGTFPYRCGPHPEMTGAVIVSATEAAAAAPPRTWDEAVAYCAQTGARLPTLDELKQLPIAANQTFWSNVTGIDTRQNPDLVRMLHEYGIGDGFEKKYAWYASATTQTSAAKTERFWVQCVKP